MKSCRSLHVTVPCFPASDPDKCRPGHSKSDKHRQRRRRISQRRIAGFAGIWAEPQESSSHRAKTAEYTGFTGKIRTFRMAEKTRSPQAPTLSGHSYTHNIYKYDTTNAINCQANPAVSFIYVLLKTPPKSLYIRSFATVFGSMSDRHFTMHFSLTFAGKFNLLWRFAITRKLPVILCFSTSYTALFGVVYTAGK